MARDFFVNGESLLEVQGGANSSIVTNLTELGLCSDPVRIRPSFRHRDINLDAWGGEIPADTQWMLAEIQINCTLIHVDISVLEEIIRLSMGAPAAFGQMARAGTRMGNNSALLSATQAYFKLVITSPVAARPWRFFATFLAQPPLEFPLGTEKSMIPVQFRVIPYTQDPYGGGTGAQNYVLFDRGST